jgi:hypothetical protein
MGETKWQDRLVYHSDLSVKARFLLIVAAFQPPGARSARSFILIHYRILPMYLV